MRPCLLLCLLTGCLPKGTVAIDDLMQLEAFDVACTRGGAEARPALSPLVWEQAAPNASATRFTAAEIGGTPIGWEMWRIDREIAPGILARSYVDIELLDDQGRAWARCTECTQEWVTRQFTPPTHEIPYASHSGSSGGGFFRGLAELGKAVLVPFTLIVDVVIVLPLKAMGADVKSTTMWLLDDHKLGYGPRSENVPPAEHPLPSDLIIVRSPAPGSVVTTATFTLHGTFHDGCSVEPLTLSAAVQDDIAQAHP